MVLPVCVMAIPGRGLGRTLGGCGSPGPRRDEAEHRRRVGRCLRAGSAGPLVSRAEGLAIGAAYSVGAISLGAFLVIGFAILNTTEGFGDRVAHRVVCCPFDAAGSRIVIATCNVALIGCVCSRGAAGRSNEASLCFECLSRILAAEPARLDSYPGYCS